MAEDTKICDELSGLPIEPIDSIVDPLKRFLHIESTSGIVLLVATILALLLANSPVAEDFLALWKKNVRLQDRRVPDELLFSTLDQRLPDGNLLFCYRAGG